MLELLEHLGQSPDGIEIGPEHGVEVLLDDEGLIEVLFLYALPRDGFSAYGGTLPRDRASVRGEFGEPRVVQPSYDLHFQDEHRIHFEYTEESLSLVTLSQQSLIFVFIPTLAALLTRAEELKEKPLIEPEVLAIRDQGTCMAMRESAALDLEDSRGYADLNPENVWEEWCEMRAQL